MERIQVSGKVNPETHKWMKEEAYKRGLTMSQLINIACTDYMKATIMIEELGGEDMVREALKLKMEAKK